MTIGPTKPQGPRRQHEEYRTRKLVRNAAQCLECGVVLESKHVHDFKYCRCKQLFVDGGLEYTRRGYRDESKVLELSEYCDGVIPNTFIACGEGGSLCSVCCHYLGPKESV